MAGFFVTGTDTDVGKTVASAWLMLLTDGAYWKPVQSGCDGDSDTRAVQELTGFADARFFPCAYELTEPLSPHEAARRDGIEIEMTRFKRPDCARPLIVEGAGGLMVPLNADALVIDLIAQLGLPAVLVCRSGLGTINHTLLSLQALRRRDVPVAGLIISGEKSPHNRQALEEYGAVPIIAEIDFLDPLTADALRGIRPEVAL